MSSFCKCPTFSSTTISGVWAELRNHYGPRVISDSYTSTLRAADLAEFTAWAAENGRDDTDYNLFGRWFNWRLSMGTTEYGNLPLNKVNDHEGMSCAPCPYDTKPDNMNTNSWNIRLNVLLGGPPTISVEHKDVSNKHYYLKVASRGSVWGFECTYSGCPYNIDHGHSYFYV